MKQLLVSISPLDSGGSDSKAARLIETIGHAGIHSPFTFWALTGVTGLCALVAVGSLYLLLMTFDASQQRYNRLFEVLENSAQAADVREAEMIATLQQTRTESRDMVAQVLSMLMRESPTKADAETRAALLSDVKSNTQRLDRISTQIENLRQTINGKTGR